MRAFLDRSSDFLLWILMPLVVAPFALGTVASLLRPSLVPTAHGLHVLPLWLLGSAAALVPIILIASGRRPTSPWVWYVYLGLIGLNAGVWLSGAWQSRLPREEEAVLGKFAPLVLAVALPWLGSLIRRHTEVALRRRIRDPALVCIAGMRGSAAVWNGLLPLLRRLGPVKALALPGFDTTPRPARRLDVEAQLAWLAGEIGDRPVVLVGHSYGAHLALRYALHEPERVRALVLITPGLLRVGEVPPRPTRLAVPWLERRLLDMPPEPSGMRICLVYGERDPLAPAVAAPEVARRLGAELHVVPGMGHLFTPYLPEMRSILVPFLASIAPPLPPGIR